MKQNKSILFLVRLYHPHVGGVEKHVHKLSQVLLKKGYSVTILTEKFDKDLRHKENIDGVTVIRMDVPESGFLKKFFIWKYILSHTDLFHNYKIIHVHDVFYWLYPILPIIIFKKVYVTFHGYEGYPVKKVWIIHRKIAEWLTKGNICVGDFMKKWYFTSPTSVIYGGVSLPNKIRAKIKDSAVFFGRLDDQTGILEYLKAYNIIKKKYPDFQMTVVGEGELVSRIPDSIVKVDFTNDIEKYISSHRFIFVSRYLSMLEALVQEKEVIAVYDNPVKRDYLKLSPFKKFVHMAKNEAEIAEFVINAIKNGSDPKILQEGYDWASQQTWENICKIYLSLWEKN